MLLKTLVRSVTLTLLAFFVIIFSKVDAQLDTASITQRLNQNKDKLGKNFAFMLYKSGKVIYKKESTDFNLKTLQPIGATSQWLTAAVALTFIGEGKLSLDDKVSDYLPIFTKYSKSFITIRHCLTHNTGIQSDIVTKVFQKSKFSSLELEVNDIASKKDIQTNPGTETKYSNVGYTILGRVLEVIAKKPFERIVKERLSVPLQMRTTTFANEDYDAGVDPSSGARSTALDMNAFLSMILNKGMYNGKTILPESSLKLLHEIQAESRQIKGIPKQNEGFDYALGEWVIEKNSNGTASAVGVPSQSGTWPVVDLCRGYSFVIFTKDLSNVPNKEFYLSFKQFIDDMMPKNCN